MIHFLRKSFAALRPALDLLWALWALLALVEVAIIFCAPVTAVHDPRFGLVNRLELVATDLAAMTLFVAVLGSSMIALTQLARMTLPGTRWVSRLARGALFLIVFVILTVYFASWVGLLTAGMFLDRQAIAFGINKPSQIVDWISPGLLLSIPALALIVGTLAAVVLPRWVRMGRPVALLWLRRAVAMAILLSMAGYLCGKRVDSPSPELLVEAGVGSPFTFAAQFERAKDQRTGPYLHTLDDFCDWIDSDQEPLRASPKYPATYQPIAAGKRWAAQVNEANAKRWNVIVVMVESLRADRLRAYGAQRDVMPACNALAADAQVFRDAYTAATHTDYAVGCSLSGNFPLRSEDQFLCPENPLSRG
jgi:glucan phosphoethanolaminetransferase (alkaline phosphatase superfamily)